MRSYDKDKIRIQNRRYYEANREAIKARTKAYYDHHKSDPTYKAKIKRKNAAWHRRRNYGVTEETYQQMLIHQNGRCSICGSDVDLCLDHCHATGKVRAIVCRRCNKVLGFSGDQPELLKKAAEYLEKQDWA